MAENSDDRKELSSSSNLADKIDFPISTPNLIIIPCNESRKGFLRDCYIKEYLADYLSKDEFDHVINQVITHTHKSYAEKRSIDNEQMPQKVMFIMLISLTMILAFFILSYMAAID